MFSRMEGYGPVQLQLSGHSEYKMSRKMCLNQLTGEELGAEGNFVDYFDRHAASDRRKFGYMRRLSGKISLQAVLP